MFKFHKLIVAGGRDFDDFRVLDNKLTSIRHIILRDDIADDLEIVCGMAKGADTLGEIWAKQNHVGVKYFPAEWEKYGRSAGPRRNRQMGDYADSLLAFWDGKSSGTKNMISYAKEVGLGVMIVKYEKIDLDPEREAIKLVY